MKFKTVNFKLSVYTLLRKPEKLNCFCTTIIRNTSISWGKQFFYSLCFKNSSSIPTRRKSYSLFSYLSDRKTHGGLECRVSFMRRMILLCDFDEYNIKEKNMQVLLGKLRVLTKMTKTGISSKSLKSISLPWYFIRLTNCSRNMHVVGICI